MKRITIFIFALILYFHFSSCDLLVENDEYTYTVIDSVQIYLMNIDGSNLRKIVDGEAPHFIPNSNLMLYRFYDKLYTIDLNNSKRNFIATATGLDIYANHELSISPDGKYVVFPARVNGIYDLFIASLDGSQVVNITNTMDRWEDSPTFSPDGDTIVYFEVIYESATKHVGDSVGLSSIDARGEHYNKIIHDSTGFRLIGFTPNNQTIIANKYDSNIGTTLYIIDAKHPHNFETIFFPIVSPAFSPQIPNDSNLYCSLYESGIFLFNFITKEKQLVCSGNILSNFVLSSDFSKAIMVNDGLELFDLRTGDHKKFLSGSKSSSQFIDVGFTPDNGKIVFVKPTHIEGNF